MIRRICLVVMLLVTTMAAARVVADTPVEKQVIITISRQDIEDGVVTQLAWDNGILLLQGVVAGADGRLSDRYFVVPAGGISLTHLRSPTANMIRYWARKSSRVSPTGLGTIVSNSDSRVALNAWAGLQSTLNQAADMGGLQTTHTLRLGSLLLFSRDGVPPYDGETYSWSPAELNRIAYVDPKGDLWIADATGQKPERLLRGNFTLPAWSEDGRSIAIAEKKSGQWEISMVYLPQRLR